MSSRAANHNGRLKPEELAPVAGGYLRADAASAFNALNKAAQQELGIAVEPLGLLATYRTYEHQVYLWERFRAMIPHVVARPGTSSHGLGLAVDLASAEMRWAVDQIGERFGWSKAWSDARGAWWHVRFRPGSQTEATERPGTNFDESQWKRWHVEVREAIDDGDPPVSPNGLYDPRRVEAQRRGTGS